MLLQLKNIQKSYGFKEILKDVSLNLEEYERIAIVGENGAGKTTLFKIITGKEKQDSGELYMSENIDIGFLNQDIINNFNIGNSIDYIDPKYFSYLGIKDFDYHPNLSGGEITKFALCEILSKNPALLLLDEPTNNLDFDGVLTLLDILNSYSGSIIAISHNRYFLDNLVNRIVELQNGVSKEYFGNYSEYRETKARQFDEAMHRYEEDKKAQKRLDNSIRQIKNWSEKAHRDSRKPDSSGQTFGLKEYRRAKAKRMDVQVKSQLKRMEKMKKDAEQRPEEEKNIYFQINSTGSHGKRVLEAIDISKLFGEKLVFENSSFVISRGDKVAVFGGNGCGKTTFAKIIQGKETLSSGELWLSPSITPYVLEQNFSYLPQDKTVKEYFVNLLGNLKGNERTILNNIGISAKHIEQKIGSLSLGEQMKVKLAEPILTEKNFLIFDEPTNHLDIHTREMLEKTLKNYNGTLLLISHDVNLLCEVCDKVLLFENNKISLLHESFNDFFEKQYDIED